MNLPIHRFVKLSCVSAAENKWFIPVSIEVTGKFPITFNEGRDCRCGSLRMRVILNNKAVWIIVQRPKELHQEHTARCAVVHFSLKLCVAQCPFSVEVSLLQSLTARKIPHRHTVQDSNILMRCLMSFFFPFSKEISHIQINSTCILPLIKFMLHNNPAAVRLCTLPSYSHPPKNIAVHVEIADSGSTNCNPGFIVTEALQFVLSGGCETCVPLTFLMFVSIQEDKMLPSSAVSPTASQNLGA